MVKDLWILKAGKMKLDRSILQMGTGYGITETIPIYATLLETSDGYILIDTGMNTEGMHNPEIWGERAKQLIPCLAEEDDIGNRLKEIDIKKSDIKYVINTHMHWDHTGGNRLFPDATFVVQKAEYRFALNPDTTIGKFHLESMSEDEINILNELLHIFYSSEDGIYVVDGKGITVRANPSFGKFAGVEIEDLIGRDVRELVREGVFSRSAASEALEEKKVKTIVQEYANGKIGLVTSTPIKNSDGEVIKIISNIRDITELSKLYDTLSAKERLIQKYSKMIDEINLLETNGIVAESEAMLNTVKVARKVAKTDGSIIILGESGVGKSMIAKLIANLSDRSGKTFVSVNCGAIPEGLMESELFGYVEGAFTGANKGGKIGLIEAADGGTLFLDEIAEIPLFLQPKLLMFLENKEVVRVGAVKPKKVNVRIIAATNKDLLDMVKQGTFRDDLYYRLNVIPITIPPLRERVEDIIPLVNNLMKDLNKRNNENKTFSKEVISIFMEYSWPGNIRQLKNVLERMYILSSGNILEYSDIPKELIVNGNHLHPSDYANIKKFSLPLSLPDEIAEMEKDLIKKALKQGGSIRKAAKLLGLSASSLFRRMEKFGCFENETKSVPKMKQNNN